MYPLLLLFFCRLLPVATVVLLHCQSGGSKAGTFLCPDVLSPNTAGGGGQRGMIFYLTSFFGTPARRQGACVARFHGAGALAPERLFEGS